MTMTFEDDDLTPVQPVRGRPRLTSTSLQWAAAVAKAVEAKVPTGKPVSLLTVNALSEPTSHVRIITKQDLDA